MKITNLILTLSLTLGACAAQSGARQAKPESAGVEAAESSMPDRDRFATHARDHIEYPASREVVLEACADTDEFTEAEKQWVADHLAEGTYSDADQLLTALGI